MVGVVKGVHLVSSEVRSATAPKVVEEVQEEVQEVGEMSEMKGMEDSRSNLHPGPHKSFGRFFFNKVNCVKPVQGSDKSREPSIFQ